MQQPRVSVIIPTYKDWERLAICLAALGLQTLPQDDFEVIIADNDPDSPVPSDFRLPGNARLIRVDQPGSYAARNAALRVAKGDTLAFTDSDCVPDPNWLSKALELFEAQPNISRIAGHVRFFVEDGRWTAAALYDRTFTLQQKRFALEGKAATANAFAYRAVFDALGPFDPELLTGGDHEWSQRAQNAGYKLAFCSQSVVAHPARSSLAQVLRKTRRFAGGTILRKRQRGDRIIVPHFDSLLPPIRRGYLLYRSTELTFWEALRVWCVLYVIRIAFFVEQVRIIFFRGAYERR